MKTWVCNGNIWGFETRVWGKCLYLWGGLQSPVPLTAGLSPDTRASAERSRDSWEGPLTLPLAVKCSIHLYRVCAGTPTAVLSALWGLLLQCRAAVITMPISQMRTPRLVRQSDLPPGTRLWGQDWHADLGSLSVCSRIQSRCHVTLICCLPSTLWSGPPLILPQMFSWVVPV